MEKTFELPNEVPGPSATELKTTPSGFDQTNMATSEYQKVTTMSSISKQNTDHQFDRFEATLAKQATALKN